MGLFDFIKKAKSKDISLTDFNFYYLYGVTDSPNNNTSNNIALRNLYLRVFGDLGGVIISNSFHPYYIVNTKGTTPWIAAYVKICYNSKKDEAFNSIANNNAVYVIDTSTVFNELNVWPDSRLNLPENAIFNKSVPFIIPFLVHKNKKRIRWNNETSDQIRSKDYIDSLSKDIRFFMSESSIIIGLDELDEKNPSKLIDNFINWKHKLNYNKSS